MNEKSKLTIETCGFIFKKKRCKGTQQIQNDNQDVKEGYLSNSSYVLNVECEEQKKNKQKRKKQKKQCVRKRKAIKDLTELNRSEKSTIKLKFINRNAPLYKENEDITSNTKTK